jgi:hypothetical protein
MKKQDFVEQIRSAQAPIRGLVEMVPNDKLDWAPATGFMTIGQLLKHLTENWGIVKMFVTGKWPFSTEQEMTEAMKLENLPSCTKEEALSGLEKDLQEGVTYIEDEISEEDFFGKVITAPWGYEARICDAVVFTRDHFLNHKMQLFLYLKLLGIPVNTSTLYGG